jgi:hypothetical protein
VTDPFRSRPPVFPRDRLLRAGLDEARIASLADEYASFSYRERVSFARFVNAHGDDAIRDRIDSGEVTAGTTQPTGGQPTDEQQLAQLDAVAASTPLAPSAPAAPAAPAPTEPTPPGSPETAPTETAPAEAAPEAAPEEAPDAAPAAPEPAQQQQDDAQAAASPAAAPAPADAPAQEPAPAPAKPATEPGPVVVAGIEVAPDPDTLNALTMDQLRAVATELPGVSPTGRKADLVSKIAPAVADLADQQTTSDTPTDTPAAAEPTDAPPEAPQVAAEPPAEAPAPADTPDAPTDATGAPQTPAATDDGGNTTGGTNP